MRSVDVLALVLTTAVSGCYLSHQRQSDAGQDGGPFVPVCDPRHPDVTCEPVPIYFATWRARVTIDGVPHDACFCAPGTCTARYGCTREFIEGDDMPLACTEHVPPSLFEGRCVRPCETTDDCPRGMACLSIEEVVGHPFDRSRACFYVAPASE